VLLVSKFQQILNHLGGGPPAQPQNHDDDGEDHETTRQGARQGGQRNQ
jgi:hypothetical protein